MVILFMAGVIAAIFFIFISTSTHKKSPRVSSKEALKSLPYLTWIPAEKDIQKSGVTKYDRKRAFEGTNIYNSRNLSKAYLIDLNGNILHTWSAKVTTDDEWHHVQVCGNGDLLAIVKDRMLIRMDWSSNIKWVSKMRYHHDIAVALNEDIYSIVSEPDLAFYRGLPLPILNNSIVIMNSDGEIKRKISLFDLLKEEVPLNRITGIFSWLNNPKILEEIIERKENNDFMLKDGDPSNILHTNTIKIIERDVNGLCKGGDLLICVLKLDLIGILNVEEEKIIWKWGPGDISNPHNPTLLENGNILIFDNGVDRGYSRIVELDPFKKEIVWEYRADPSEHFYSQSRGSSQRLPNGNTLITESDKGHVFEVSHSGEIVWEFYNPEIKTDKGERAAIYRMIRIMDTEKYPWLEGLKKQL